MEPSIIEEQPSCGLKWASVPPIPPEEPETVPLELTDVQVALDDDPDEETPRPGEVRESGLCLLLSGSMHFLIIALLLYSTSYASGLAGRPGPGLGNMMVGLYEGLGDPLEDGDGQDAPGGSEETAEAEPETAGLPPEPEPADLNLEKIAAPPEPELVPLEPDAEAIALEKPKPEPRPEPKKNPPPKKAAKKAEPKPKAAAPAAKKSESVGPADQAGTGRGAGPGRSIGAGVGGGQKGGGGGGGAGGGGKLAGYRKANFNHIVKLIQRKMVYPPEVKKAGITGTAKVAFTIGRNGQATGIRLAASSGNGSLDQAALSAVRRASPFPAPPDPAHITIPLRFSLR